MRFIPTFDTRVEQLKLEAKKIQRKRGGKHTELLDKVARGAGYDHWHHVVQCQKRTASKQGGEALLAALEKDPRKGNPWAIAMMAIPPNEWPTPNTGSSCCCRW